MKILLLGDANSHILFNYVKWLRKNCSEQITIDIFSTVHEKNVDEIKKSIYDKIYFPYKNKYLVEDIKYLRIILKPLALINNFKKIKSNYDIIHIHHVFPFYKSLTNHFCKISRHVIATIWGFEFFFNLSKHEIKMLSSLYAMVDIITFANQDLACKFKDLYKLGDNKIRYLKFGLEPFTILSQIVVKYTASESKQILGFDEKKISVVIGYSAKRIHNHLEILDSFVNFEDFNIISKRSQFVFPMTYSKNKSYIDQVKEKAKQLNLDAIFIEKFLSEDEVAHLRNASDIFLQFSQFDHTSGSVLESLYGGAIVLFGDWLPYNFWKKNGLYLKSLPEIKSIPKELLKITTNLEFEKQLCAINRFLLHKQLSWEDNIKDWFNLYSEILNLTH